VAWRGPGDGDGAGGATVAAAPPASKPASPAAGATAAPPPAVPDPVVTEMPPDPVAAPPVAAEPPPPSNRAADRGRHHHHHERVRAGAGPTAAAPTSAEVQSRFRAALHEYQDFKARYGARLESEWNDLAHLATFASQGDRLGELDSKISEFRSHMRAVEQQGGGK
jgi:hypothetical protein